MSYIVVQNFQYMDDNKKVMVLPVGTKLGKLVDGTYPFYIKQKYYALDQDIVENNPDFFNKIDFTTLLIDLIKANKKRTAPKLAEIINELVETEIMEGKELIQAEHLDILATACFIAYKTKGNDTFLQPLIDMGYKWDEKGVSK